jgi:hypothetical protein
MNFWKPLYKIDLDITSDLVCSHVIISFTIWLLGENNMTFKCFYMFWTKNNTRLPKDESTSTIYWFRCTTSGKRGTKTFCWITTMEFGNLPCNSRQFGLMFTLTTFESIGMIELSNDQSHLNSILLFMFLD